MPGKKVSSAKPSKRPRDQTGPQASETDVQPASLPIEVWQRVASYMSTKSVAKGLARTCKGMWNMSYKAICLTSGKKEGLQWACKRWGSASKLCLHPSKDEERSTLMAWAALHCNAMGSLTELAVLNDAVKTEGRHSAAAVAAMVALMGHHASSLQVVHLDMWDVPELPCMSNLKHLVLSMGQRFGAESNSSDFVWTCLQHLTGLETLDLTVISRRNENAHVVDLSALQRLRKLRLVNVLASKLSVRRECSISILQSGVYAFNMGMGKDKELRVQSATFLASESMLQQGFVTTLLSNWIPQLQKVDISVSMVGDHQNRLRLSALAQIPVVRLRSKRGLMYITMPKSALWQYLWLEAPAIDCEFQDFSAFGQSLHGIKLIFGSFDGGKHGSDVLLCHILVKNGLRRVMEVFDKTSKRKTLCARRRGVKAAAKTVHDTCTCGACPACLVAAGVMHDHGSGGKVTGGELLPLQTMVNAAPYSGVGNMIEDYDDSDSDEECCGDEDCCCEDCIPFRAQDPDFYREDGMF